MSEVEEDATSAGTEMLASLGINLNQVDEVEEPFEPIQVAQPQVVVASPPEFSVLRSVLVAMVDQVMEVVPTRDFVPALKNIVLDVSDDQLTMTGSDSTSTVIAHTTAVRVVRPGKLLIGAKKFSGVVKLAAGNEVTLRAEDQMLHVGSGAVSWSLRVSPVQDYVPLAQLGDLTWHNVDRERFSRAVAAVRFAASSDDNDPARQQLFVSHGAVTATDTRCFAQVSGLLPPDLTCEITTAAVDLLIKMLDRNDAKEFRLADTDFHTVAEIGPPESPDRMIVAHIAEDFPFEAVNAAQTPLAENRDELRVNGEALLEALRRAVPTSDEETSAVALRVGVPDAGSVTVATRNRYGDDSTEAVAGEFQRPGTENVPAARTLLLSHTRLTQAIRAVAAVAPAGGEGGTVLLRLGTDRSQSRRAYVLVENLPGEEEEGLVRIVVNQVRSDWLQ